MPRTARASCTPSDVEHAHTTIVRLNEIAQGRGQTLAEMSVAWLLAHKAVTSVLIGASKPQQVVDDVKALENTTFTDDELVAIDEASGLAKA